jgi:methylmalonyl-CoA mutase cobalamin-binding subunit
LNPVKVLVCGDRRWTDAAAVERELKKFPPGTVVIHGGARGADTIAAQTAARLGFEVIAFPARWELYGRAAGPIRNSEMLAQDPDLVIAFHADLAASRGTKDVVSKARRAGVRVILVTGGKGSDPS